MADKKFLDAMKQKFSEDPTEKTLPDPPRTHSGSSLYRVYGSGWYRSHSAAGLRNRQISPLENRLSGFH